MENKNPYVSEKRPDWETPYNLLLDYIKELQKESSINRGLLMAIYSHLSNKTIAEISAEFERISQQEP